MIPPFLEKKKMPEIDVVAVYASLLGQFVGRAVKTSSVSVSQYNIVSDTLTGVISSGKTLRLFFTGEKHISCHLGINGYILFGRDAAAKKKSGGTVKWIIMFTDGTEILFCDGQFGKLALLPTTDSDREVSDVRTREISWKSRKLHCPLHKFLMDQKQCPGIGNMLRAELVHILMPERPFGSVHELDYSEARVTEIVRELIDERISFLSKHMDGSQTYREIHQLLANINRVYEKGSFTIDEGRKFYFCANKIHSCPPPPHP